MSSNVASLLVGGSNRVMSSECVMHDNSEIYY
jgi:hypothetical protein